MNPKPIYNFGAGPACLPQAVLTQICQDIPDWYDGMSVMEVSHRLPAFMDLTQEIEADLRTLLQIPDDFAVLFMHGGARGQFSAVPLNLLQESGVADYIDTGVWSGLAYEEAKKYGQPHLVASAQSSNYTQIPDQTSWSFSQDGAYLYYVDNETIQGLEFPQPPLAEKWLVSDMTSSILSKPIDFSRYGLIFASAQKNLGIAGITVVIVRKTLMGKAHRFTPSILDYQTIEASKSLYNTPAMFNWYVLGLVLKWAKQQFGDCAGMAAQAAQKSNMIYNLIDRNDFYHNPVFPAHRSKMNIPFRLKTPQLENLFLEKAHELNLKQLKGHKLVGGCRASIYNAMPLSGVQALADFMQMFAQKHG